MTSDPPLNVKEIFVEIVERSPEQRAAYLDEHCPNPQLRAAVEALLRHHSEAGSWTADATRDVLDTGTGIPAHDLVGRHVAEFAIVRKIGTGGMGIVYLARDVSLDRAVALKVLAPHAASELGIGRFKNEARAIARLKHPGIVPVYQVGEFEGLHYIAMEFVEGDTLAACIAREAEARHASGGAETGTRQWHQTVATIVARVADALEHAHQRRIVHRDVKPSNILIDRTGEPHLMDFGLAKTLGEAGITQPGGLAGTAAYMSPEQARAASSEIDHRSDVYSLGVVLYEAVALKPPFEGDLEQVLNAVLFADPEKLRTIDAGVGRDLETICHKALEKEPWHRYQAAGIMAGELRCYVESRPILARPPSLARCSRRWLREHRAQSVASLFATLLVTIAALVWLQVRDRHARMCAVTLVADVTSATVFVQRYDEQTYELGGRERLGSTPLHRRLLDPGQYRFTVVRGDGAFAEASSLLVDPGGETRIDLTIHARDGDWRNGMVKFDGGSYEFGRTDGAAFETRRTVLLDAFWIDRHEVSNGQYKSFVDATGHAPPPHWDRFGYDEALERHPVVAITWHDAQAYARWVGKRLPTIFEWECAARAPDGRLRPWGDGDPPAWPEVSLAAVNCGSSGEWDPGYAAYSDHVGETDSGGDETPLGLRHTFGNVAEMTDNVDVAQRAMLLKGGDWTNSPECWDLSRTSSRPYASRSLLSGFRCAASDAAPGL